MYCGTDLQTRQTPREAMETSHIQENEPKKVEYAKTGERFVAFLIDSMVIGLIAAIFTLPFAGAFWWSFDAVYTMLWNILYFPIAIIYYVAMETNRGQTLGKKAMKLKTIDVNTLQDPTTQQHFLNNLTKTLGILFFIDLFVGYISNKKDPKNQIRYTQQLSKTGVIKFPN